MIANSVKCQDVAKMYMNTPFTEFTSERDRKNLVYDFEHGDTYDRIKEVTAVVERFR